MTDLAPAEGERELRVDARRNLDRIFEAARAAFAELGTGCGVAEIARRAGVGNATIFRRFPAKEDLINAVVEQCLREHLDEARRAAGSADPGAALFGFMETVVGWQVSDRALMDSLPSRVFVEPRLRELHEELAASLGDLLASAQHAGMVRDDVAPQDLAVLGNAVARVGTSLERAAPGVWRRYLTIVLDGLRPGAQPLQGAAPAWEAMCVHDCQVAVPSPGLVPALGLGLAPATGCGGAPPTR